VPDDDDVLELQRVDERERHVGVVLVRVASGVAAVAVAGTWFSRVNHSDTLGGPACGTQPESETDTGVPVCAVKAHLTH
jgi:hypothetical protein